MVTKIDISYNALLAHYAVGRFSLRYYRKWKGRLRGLQLCLMWCDLKAIRLKMRAESAISFEIGVLAAASYFHRQNKWFHN